MASVLQAHAQTVPADVIRSTAVAETAAVDANDADIRDLQLDWSRLNVDASTLTTGPASKARSPQAGPGSDMSWSSRDKPNGAAALSVKQPLSLLWDARVGADMTVARQPATVTASEQLSERLANGGSPPQSSGTAWAAITAPGVAVSRQLSLMAASASLSRASRSASAS